MLFEVSGRADHSARALPDLSRRQCGVLKRAHAQRDIYSGLNQIDVPLVENGAERRMPTLAYLDQRRGAGYARVHPATLRSRDAQWSGAARGRLHQRAKAQAQTESTRPATASFRALGGGWDVSQPDAISVTTATAPAR
jgi:hypothetical protein